MKHLIYEMLNDGRCQMIKTWAPRTYTYSGCRRRSFVNRSHTSALLCGAFLPPSKHWIKRYLVTCHGLILNKGNIH